MKFSENSFVTLNYPLLKICLTSKIFKISKGYISAIYGHKSLKFSDNTFVTSKYPSKNWCTEILHILLSLAYASCKLKTSCFINFQYFIRLYFQPLVVINQWNFQTIPLWLQTIDLWKNVLLQISKGYISAIGGPKWVKFPNKTFVTSNYWFMKKFLTW